MTPRMPYKVSPHRDNLQIKPEPRNRQAEALAMRRQYWELNWSYVGLVRIWRQEGWTRQQIDQVLFYKVWASLQAGDAYSGTHAEDTQGE